jgi:hypothetical protein
MRVPWQSSLEDWGMPATSELHAGQSNHFEGETSSMPQS